MSSIPERPANGTRWWCTWTPRSWRIRTARAIGAGRGDPRPRGDVPAVGVRREPGGDGARPRRAGRRGRGPNADDSAGAAAGAAASGPHVPVPGLRRRVSAGASRAALGRRAARRRWRNLVLLCRRHHRAVHEEGYRIAREPDDASRSIARTAACYRTVPAPAAVPADPVAALRAEHAAQGLQRPPRRRDSPMAGRAARRGLGPRCTASAGEVRRGRSCVAGRTRLVDPGPRRAPRGGSTPRCRGRRRRRWGSRARRWSGH